MIAVKIDDIQFQKLQLRELSEPDDLEYEDDEVELNNAIVAQVDE